MTYDFTIAAENSALLRNESFMAAMRSIALAVGNLISENPDRAKIYDEYAKENDVTKNAHIQAEGMLFFGEMAAPSEEVKDPYAISQMMRILVKEAGLACAIKSGAVSLSELKQIGIQQGVISNKEVDALGRMGAPSLAAVAALNM